MARQHPSLVVPQLPTLSVLLKVYVIITWNPVVYFVQPKPVNFLVYQKQLNTVFNDSKDSGGSGVNKS